MNTSLIQLSASQRLQLDAVVQIIIQSIHPEKIILFGVYSMAENAALLADMPAAALTPFDLLVITDPQERRSDYELQDLVENRCREIAPVTTVIHDIFYVNRQICARQYFFSLIGLEGVLLYDKGTFALEKARLPDFEEVRLTAEKDYRRWAGQASAFFNSAQFNCRQKEWKIATFLLHQAAEQIYQAILLVFTGYKPTTHNLDKLRRYTNRFSFELTTLFPRDNGDEDYLFRLLLSGYVDARYKDNFTISEEEVTTLAFRVGKLLDIARRICTNHFLSLTKRAAG